MESVLVSGGELGYTEKKKGNTTVAHFCMCRYTLLCDRIDPARERIYHSYTRRLKWLPIGKPSPPNISRHSLILASLHQACLHYKPLAEVLKERIDDEAGSR